MDFDFSPEQLQLKDQARRFLSDQCDRTAVRAVLDGPQSFDAHLWQGLADLGYLGAAIPEAYGGLGAGYLAGMAGIGVTGLGSGLNTVRLA